MTTQQMIDSGYLFFPATAEVASLTATQYSVMVARLAARFEASNIPPPSSPDVIFHDPSWSWAPPVPRGAFRLVDIDGAEGEVIYQVAADGRVRAYDDAHAEHAWQEWGTEVQHAQIRLASYQRQAALLRRLESSRLCPVPRDAYDAHILGREAHMEHCEQAAYDEAMIACMMPAALRFARRIVAGEVVEIHTQSGSIRHDCYEFRMHGGRAESRHRHGKAAWRAHPDSLCTVQDIARALCLGWAGDLASANEAQQRELLRFSGSTAPPRPTFRTDGQHWRTIGAWTDAGMDVPALVAWEPRGNAVEVVEP